MHDLFYPAGQPAMLPDSTIALVRDLLVHWIDRSIDHARNGDTSALAQLNLLCHLADIQLPTELEHEEEA